MTTEDTGAAVQRLLDRDAIEELSRHYLRGLDRRDEVLLRSVFHDDADTHYGSFAGTADEFVTMAMHALSTHEANQHLMGQVNLWFPHRSEPRRAEGEVYFQAFHRVVSEGVRTDLFVCGRYIDRYEQRDGRWGITHRTEVVDWSRTEPTADDYLPRRPHAVRGQHGRSDLSYRIEEAGTTAGVEDPPVVS